MSVKPTTNKAKKMFAMATGVVFVVAGAMVALDGLDAAAQFWGQDHDGRMDVLVLKGDYAPPKVDKDGDGVKDWNDNCEADPNPSQADSDNDGEGDACDENNVDGPFADPDGDGYQNTKDNCNYVSNPDQKDADGDGKGDACDPDDTDGPAADPDDDGKLNANDNCRHNKNPAQTDTDGDGTGDACQERWTADEFSDILNEDVAAFIEKASYQELHVDFHVVGTIELEESKWEMVQRDRADPDRQFIHVALEALLTHPDVAEAVPCISMDDDGDPDFQYDAVMAAPTGWHGGKGTGGPRWPSNVPGLTTFCPGLEPEDETAYMIVGENWDRYSADNVWGRVAHELGHNIGLEHVSYGYKHCHDIMGGHCAYPVLPSVFTREDESVKWVEETGERDYWLDPQHIETLLPRVPVENQEFALTPLASDPAGSEDTKALKIPLWPTSDTAPWTLNPDFGKNYYLIECRPAIGQDVRLTSEGVMIYHVNEWNNQRSSPYDDGIADAPVWVMDATPSSGTVKDAAWQPGQVFTADPGGADIRIEVQSFTPGTADPCVVNVRFIPPDQGPPDAYIRDWGEPPGDPGPYYTQDIWVDSLVNNNDVTGDMQPDWAGQNDLDGDGTPEDAQVYRYHVEGDKSTPDARQGDPPLIGEKNRIYAQITNIGDSPIEGHALTVHFGWKKPQAGGGIEDENNRLTEVICDTVSDLATSKNGCTKARLEPGEKLLAWHQWTPSAKAFSSFDLDEDSVVDVHACLTVSIDRVPFETVGTSAADEPDGNNHAQENLHTFQTSKGSPYRTVSGFVEVLNPHPDPVFVEVLPERVPENWVVEMAWDTATLSPGETRLNNYTVQLPESTPVGEYAEFDIPVFHWLYDGFDHEHPHRGGGITVGIATVDPPLDVTLDDPGTGIIDGPLPIRGAVTSETGAIPAGLDRVTALIEPPVVTAGENKTEPGETVLRVVPVDTDGTFAVDFDPTTVQTDPAGLWAVRIHVPGDVGYESAESATMTYDVAPATTPTTTAGDPTVDVDPRGDDGSVLSDDGGAHEVEDPSTETPTVAGWATAVVLLAAAVGTRSRLRRGPLGR